MDTLIGNRFRVLSELGAGAMGAVYRVADTLGGDRELALKRIQTPGGITPALRLRFKEEFRAMARLKHPNTIAVIDYGALDDQTQYLTMELVEGRGLDELIASGPLAFDVGYKLLIQLLQALDFIHARLYVHRDIKAQNIRVTPDGTLKLMDFGLMAQLGLPAESGSLSGSPGYMPPEAIRGGVITAAADLYSVGCLAYQLFTGRLPFEGTLREVVRAHIDQTPAPMRRWRAEVPEGLERIVTRLLAKEPTRRYQRAADVVVELARLAGLAVARPSLEQQRSYLVAGTLVGRESELAALEFALDEALAGRGRAIYLSAPAGVGKSRLAHELALQAKLKDVTVLHGQCREGGSCAMLALSEALRPLLALSSPAERLEHGPLLRRLFPELRGEGACSAPDAAETARLQASLAAWLGAIAERQPLAVVLEDLHWADPFTLEALNGLLPHLEDCPVLVVATLRSDEAPAGSPVWLPVLEGHARLLTLAPLDRDQVARLVAEMLHDAVPDAAFVDWLFDATAGNTFFVTEVLRLLMEEGVLTRRDGRWHLPAALDHLAAPASIEAAVLRRVGQLSPCARRVAAVAAVIGRHQELSALAALGGLEEERLFEVLDELVAAQFLHKDEGGYTFPHDRVREALYDELAPDERQALHRRCGTYLEQLGEEGADVASLAHHFSRGADHARAVDYLVRQGDRAHAEGGIPAAVEAWHQAIAHLEALTEYPERLALLARLRTSLGVFGFNVQPGLAIEALERALPYLHERYLAGDEGAGPRVMQATAALAGSYGFYGRPLPALKMARRLEKLMPDADGIVRGAQLAVFCTSHFPAGRFDELVATAKAAAPYLVGVDLSGHLPLVYSTRVGAASYQNAVAYQGVRPNEQLRDYALWAAREVKAHYLEGMVHHFFAIWYAWTGREDEAIAVMEQVSHLCRSIGAPPHPFLLYLRPFILWQRGEFGDARALVRQAFRYPHLEQSNLAKLMLQVLDGMLATALGEPAEAERLLVSVQAHATEHGLLFIRLQALLARGEAALAAGELARARALLDEVRNESAAGPSRNPLHEALALKQLGFVAIAERRHAEARTLLASARAIAEAPEQDNLILQAHLYFADGVLAESAGDAAAARAAWVEAAGRFHRLKNRHMLHVVTARLDALAGVASAHVPQAPIEAAREVMHVPSWMRGAGSLGQGW